MVKFTYKETKKFLRFYESQKLPNGDIKIIRAKRFFTGDPLEAAERIAIEHESDEFFRWYEPVEEQIKGKHW